MSDLISIDPLYAPLNYVVFLLPRDIYIRLNELIRIVKIERYTSKWDKNKFDFKCIYEGYCYIDLVVYNAFFLFI